MKSTKRLNKVQQQDGIMADTGDTMDFVKGGVVDSHGLSVCMNENGDNMAQKDMTKAKADELSEILSDDANRQRGQTHGAAGANIGGIAGCISLKRRQGATHYVGVFKVSEMGNTETPRMVQTRASVKGAAYAVHCFAHGTQRPVPSRRAAMHSVRCAGKSPTGAFAKGAISLWCNACVKGQASKDD